MRRNYVIKSYNNHFYRNEAVSITFLALAGLCIVVNKDRDISCGNSAKKSYISQSELKMTAERERLRFLPISTSVFIQGSNYTEAA